MKQYLLFDLDGTLSDSKPGIVKAVRHSLTQFGIEVPDLETLRPFIGPPLRDAYRSVYGFDADETERAVAAFREYYTEKGIDENEMYPGVEAMLKRLHGLGRTLILATSKPAVFAARILDSYQVSHYFTFIAGSELDGARSDKAEVITHARKTCGITHAAAALMIGDREHDIYGARACGLESVGVLYGYGTRRELEAAGASALAKDTEALAELLADWS